MKQVFRATALLLSLAACSPESADQPGAAPGPTNETGPPVAASPPPPAPALPARVDATATNVLTLEGLGALRIGRAIPVGSGWAERGAQISDECRIVTSPDFPGVYAIVEGGRVRRITIGERSDVKLAEGIGVGAAEAEVRAAFPRFREAPHEYVDPPAKYLTAPDASRGGPALRFEIGADGRVSLVHAGTMPVLGYVEGCA